MIEEIIVPKLGMAAAVVTLTEWKVEQGGRIEKGDTIVDLEAEKSIFEMPAPRSGFVHILLPQGAEADVSTVIALLAEKTPEEYASLTQGAQSRRDPNSRRARRSGRSRAHHGRFPGR